MHKVGYTLRLENDMHVSLLAESIKGLRGAACVYGWELHLD
jgi:hypothetical protein